LTAATFSRGQSEALWRLDGCPGSCLVGFAPFDPAGVPETGLTLAEAWSTHPGTFVVLPPQAALDAGFAARLAAYLGWREAGTARFAWIADPAAGPREWDAWTICCDGGGTTRGPSGIVLRNLALWIGGGCAAAPDGGGERIVLAAPAGAVTMTAGFGASAFECATGTVAIPFSGPQAGCVTTGVELVDEGAGAGFDRLDVGLRSFAPAPGPSPLWTGIVSHRCPLFAAAQPAGATSIPASVSFDPAAPLDPTRSFLGLVPENAATGTRLASWFRTVNRLAVGLTPLASPAAKLVPAVRALSDPASDFDPFYLVPQGAFQVDVAGAAGWPQRLMCGASGIEYVELPGPGCELWFSPGGAALAGEQGLDPAATTAYASVFGAGGTSGPAYLAQPDGGALFGAGGTAGFLVFSKLSGVSLGEAPHGELPAGFPMLPYAGVEAADLGPYQEIEQRAVSPTRRRTIGGAGSGRARRALGPGVPLTPTVTPQGLLAEVGGGEIANLKLIVTGSVLEVQGVSPELASALQSNQLFLVASDPSSLQAEGAPPVDGTVTIPPADAERWTIDAWPAKWSETGTLLVMKFAGKPLLELARDLGTWVEAEAFNGGSKAGVEAAQKVLLASIEEARERRGADPEFEPFAALAEEASWQGLLVLNAPIPPAELPPQLSGLAAGIDASRFKAHHVGLTVTPVSAGGGEPTQKLSALFGLIFYESETDAAGAKGPYAFNVLSLKVRFANSAVATFSSRIQLLADAFFGEPATRTDPATGKPCADNVLVLEGVYQQQGASSGYSFSSEQENVFAMTSSVLSSVEVASAQFVTVVSPEEAKQQKRRAESRFVMSGALRFLPPAASGGFDLFSFGPETTAPLPLSGQRLACSNLAVDLEYEPGERGKDSYAFDATKLVLDAAQSVARDGGVFHAFPLTLSGFVHAEPGAAGSAAGASPSSLGFLGVEVPGLPQGSIAAPWFGIVADLGLGSAGALAAQAGFKASLLAAWAPGGGGQANVAVGLKLPGTGSGGKLLSLESVLKLKVGGTALVREPDAYVLALERIALSLLTLTFPPGGQVDALLFADPTGQDHTTLGWYAGYAKSGGK
jgi:hypothetical protein